jgi:hypothetical protein
MITGSEPLIGVAWNSAIAFKLSAFRCRVDTCCVFAAAVAML